MSAREVARRHAAPVSIIANGLLLFTVILRGEPVAVRHAEGVAHGSLALRTLAGATIATGDLVQEARDAGVTTRATFRFTDGSVQDETAVFSQQGQFRLHSDHLVQRGPSFPRPLDMTIDAAAGVVTVRYVEDGQAREDRKRLALPADLANGLVPILLKNLEGARPPASFSYVVATPTPGSSRSRSRRRRPKTSRRRAAAARPCTTCCTPRSAGSPAPSPACLEDSRRTPTCGSWAATHPRSSGPSSRCMRAARCGASRWWGRHRTSRRASPRATPVIVAEPAGDSRIIPSRMSLAPGLQLGPYEIVGALGAGGMGEVYRAHDPRLGRDVAIKVLPPAYSLDADRLHRFELEARAAAALNHPNILAVFDIGQHDGAPYIVSELLEGETLRSRLQATPSRPLPRGPPSTTRCRSLAASRPPTRRASSIAT